MHSHENGLIIESNMEEEEEKRAWKDRDCDYKRRIKKLSTALLMSKVDKDCDYKRKATENAMKHGKQRRAWRLCGNHKMFPFPYHFSHTQVRLKLSDR